MGRQTATLVAIEFGASWPQWLDPGRAGTVAVVAQHYEGAPASLTHQVASRLQRLIAMDWHFDRAVLVSNGRGDLESLSARAQLTRGLLTYLRDAGGTSLVLSVARELGRRAAHSVTLLASSLRGDVANGIDVSVRIGVDEPFRAPGAPSHLLRIA
jgi:hypothetical protein